MGIFLDQTEIFSDITLGISTRCEKNSKIRLKIYKKMNFSRNNFDLSRVSNVSIN